MRVLRQHGARAAEEDMNDEAQGVGHGQAGRQRRQCRHQPAVASPVGKRRLLQHHLLGQEAVQRRHPGHRGPGHQGERGGDRHPLREPAQAPDVARAGFVVDDAGDHEQRGLEARVVEDVEHRRQRRHRRAEAQQHRHQPQVADGRIRQHRLQVVLEQRDQRARQHGHQSGRRHQVEPGVGAGEHRPQPRQQEHARLHHRRRMQVGRHRRRRRHRMRQPEVEGKLRTLGEAAGEDQQQRRQVVRRALDRLGLLQDVRQAVGLGDVAEDQHAADHRQPAGRGHRQRHARALPSFRQVLPVADQQEGRQAGQFPEHQQQQHVVRQHDAQHRALEGQQIGHEAAHRIAPGKVEARIDDDQQADAQDEQREQEAQAIKAEVQVQPQRRQPAPARLDRLALQHVGQMRQQQSEGAEAEGERRPGAGVAAGTDRQRSQGRADEGQQDDQWQAHRQSGRTVDWKFISLGEMRRRGYHSPQYRTPSQHQLQGRSVPAQD